MKTQDENTVRKKTLFSFSLLRDSSLSILYFSYISGTSLSAEGIRHVPTASLKTTSTCHLDVAT